MRRRQVFYLLMIIIAVLAPLILAELTLRLVLGKDLSERDLRRRLAQSREASLADSRGRYSLFGLVQASEYPDVVYELKPGLRGTFRDQPISTNAHGLRDAEVELKKPAGTFRVVGLGDSHMFGWGAAQGETYMDLLEGKLNTWLAAAPQDEIERFEVLNCAVPGYNTTMEVATFEQKCRAFDPDFIVMHFVGNDFELPHFMQPPRSAAEGLYLATFLKTVWSLIFGEERRGEDADLLPHDRSHLPKELRRSSQRQYRHMLGEEPYRRAMARLAELAGERSTTVLVTMLGDASARRRLVVEVAAEQGFHRLNTAPRFHRYLLEQDLPTDRKHWRRMFQIPKDGHPSALAHRLYAEAIFDELKKLIPETRSRGSS